jgi:hypothetical protein
MSDALQIVLVEVPVIGSPKYLREVKPQYRHHRAQRPPPGLPRQEIPRPDRRAVSELLRAGKRMLESERPPAALRAL